MAKPHSNLAEYLKRWQEVPRSLTSTPTHAHCDEVVALHRKHGLETVAYPRLDATTCARYDEAQAVVNRGLSFRAALCPDCPLRGGCPYDEQFVAAAGARHAVTTHARTTVAMADLVRHKTVLSLQEAPLDALRPLWATDRGLELVELVARTASYAHRPEARGFFRHPWAGSRWS